MIDRRDRSLLACPPPKHFLQFAEANIRPLRPWRALLFAQRARRRAGALAETHDNGVAVIGERPSRFLISSLSSILIPRIVVSQRGAARSALIEHRAARRSPSRIPARGRAPRASATNPRRDGVEFQAPIAAGADFIVLNANPLDDIANTRKIERVYLRGQEVPRAELKARWQAGFGIAAK
jgi:hypothetical protein